MAKRRALGLLLCLLLLLCTACGGQAQENDGALHCTVKIACSTVLEHMDDLKPGKADIVPPDGVLLPETTVAFSEGDTVFDVLQRLREGEKMVAVVAPAILGQYNAPTEKVYGAIKAIGFEDVIEVAQGAMETIRNEGAELEEKIEEGQAFMTTSCCPSWVELANKHIPEMKPFISSTGSPMYYAARIAKEKHPDAQVVFIGPCVAKRKEARRDECVDFVMTFEEINSIFDGLGIEVATTDPFPIPFVSTRAAHGFAQAGGVMGAVQLFLADNNRPQVEGIQVSNLNKKNVSLLRAYAKSGKAPAKFIEVMACEGGCITGPSTHNLHDAGKRQFAKELAKR